MSRLTSRSMASLIVVVALVAAGCGSSSSSKSANTSAGASTPATPATPSTPSTGTSTTATPGKVSPSASVSSPQFKAVLVAQAERSGATAGKATQFVDCFVTALQGEGIKTAGDFKANQAKAKTAVAPCNKSVGTNVKP
ncbi:MAG TPA: hypothetical protein VGY32_10070 [Solirubrobacteraceae bacterium]|nr:hypothetical protein [Solirubrobacteraceae bacterium]